MSIMVRFELHGFDRRKLFLKWSLEVIFVFNHFPFLSDVDADHMLKITPMFPREWSFNLPSPEHHYHNYQNHLGIVAISIPISVDRNKKNSLLLQYLD